MDSPEPDQNVGTMMAAVASATAALVIALEQTGALSEEWTNAIVENAKALIDQSSQDATLIAGRQRSLRTFAGMLAAVRAIAATEPGPPN